MDKGVSRGVRQLIPLRNSAQRGKIPPANNTTTGDPKSRNGGMAEWRKMTPNPKTRNGGK